MERWLQYAFFSMVFAGFTSVIAKLGLAGISADLGLAIRTCFVFVFVLMFAGVVVPSGQWQTLSTRNFLWLGLSGVTTALSWVFYYRAIKLGEVSTVALIDKGSVLVALLMSAWLLHEAITPAKLIGAAQRRHPVVRDTPSRHALGRQVTRPICRRLRAQSYRPDPRLHPDPRLPRRCPAASRPGLAGRLSAAE